MPNQSLEKKRKDLVFRSLFRIFAAKKENYEKVYISGLNGLLFV